MKSRGMRRTFASTDVTYCTNRDCSKKCWRHVDNYRFDLDLNYSYMQICEKEQERREYGDTEE